MHFHPTLVDIIKELNNNDDENSPLFKVAYVSISDLLIAGIFIKKIFINMKRIKNNGTFILPQYLYLHRKKRYL